MFLYDNQYLKCSQYAIYDIPHLTAEVHENNILYIVQVTGTKTRWNCNNVNSLLGDIETSESNVYAVALKSNEYIILKN